MLPSEKLSVFIFVAFWAYIYASEAIFLVSALRHKKFPSSMFMPFIHTIALGGILALGYAYFIEPYWVDVHYVTIHTHKLKSTAFTVVQISDLHCDTKIRSERKVVKLINGIKPDVIVFTGDSLNSPEALGNLHATLKDMHASLGKFAVLGNWDTWYWNHLNLFEGTDFIELNKGFKAVEKNHEQLMFAGLAAGNTWPNFFVLKERFSVFLYHYPDLIEDITPANVDLYLAGHTHGGQVALPFYGALVTFSKFGKKYEAGLYKVGHTVLYVNRGIGMEGGMAPRIRFFARPEITVFKIQP